MSYRLRTVTGNDSNSAVIHNNGSNIFNMAVEKMTDIHIVFIIYVLISCGVMAFLCSRLEKKSEEIFELMCENATLRQELQAKKEL